MYQIDLQRLNSLENQIAATAEAQRAPLIAALERLVAQAQGCGMAIPEEDDILDEDLFDNMPV